MKRRTAAGLLTVSLTAALVAGGCGGSDDSTRVPQPTADQMAAAGLEKLPIAPESKRIDLEMPPFSDPTKITNPLFPISDLQSVVFSGKVEGKPFHTETTLLPQMRVIELSDGQRIETRVSQYFAYLDGRIEEVALDYYAQADDGAVWYFGEDVHDYGKEGLIDANSGSWLAGKEGPAQMIMPGDPKVGDVFRAENIPGLAFEEVTVKKVDKTVDGPTGSVESALVGQELHDDGTYSDKVFAPGYGEFYSAHEGDVEAMALAVPTDSLGGPVPPELEALSKGADEAFTAVGSGNWSQAASGANGSRRAWKNFRQGDVPQRLAAEMDRSLKQLTAGIQARDEARAGSSAIDVAQSALDLELRHRPQAEVDQARFGLWVRQVEVDAAARNLGGVRGDIATLEWIRDRFVHTLRPGDRTRIDLQLTALRDTVSFGLTDLAEASVEATKLQKTLAELQPAS